jgi:methylmalonyl-CoA mutase
MSSTADQITETSEAQTEQANPLRFVTAASLFDGHDAAINIMRRLIQAQGAEVIHLGHNRSVLGPDRGSSTRGRRSGVR